MNREDIFEWTMQEYGTTPDYPWQDEEIKNLLRMSYELTKKKK